MIYDKLENFSKYSCLNENFAKLAKYLKETDLAKLPLGKTVIDEDRIFVIHVDFESFDDTNALYEYHKRYADVHVVLDEKEQYFFDFSEKLVNKVTDYSEENDVALYKKDSTRNLIRPLKGEFLIFLPGDAHLPKYTGQIDVVRKIIFKVEY
ncbi:YhcH/YjgK/YiaL family protein [Mesomycoplasma ovipneumoniae]|uniref:YhcH/YjgK/YiaL family protein n=1 Tax=Mesomycoplasma ovipneumoniae TaxID=29562 RepID=UPI003081025F